MKKTLIISQDGFETSTDDVIDWVVALGGAFDRINGSVIDDGQGLYYSSAEGKWSILNQKIEDYHSIWFRRWGGGNKSLTTLGEKLNSRSKRYIFQKYYSIVENILREQNSLSAFFLYHLGNSKIKYLSKPNQVNVHKLIVLERAKKAGLNIPEYIICDNKESLMDFLSVNDRVISKDINDAFHFYHPKEQFGTYAELITQNNLDEIPDTFIPSLVQKYIEKKIEIRTFFFMNEIKSMAIFSQNDSKTKVDFRKYNLKKPNRTVPFKLPVDIEHKLTDLMKSLDLETGSIDLIMTPSNDFYFLEVNPVGQFGMVSQPCNYPLEKMIAEYLLS